jgi:rhodanese-related sulfurtransferase
MFALLMGLRTVSPAELQRLLAGKQAAAFDVNSPQSFGQAHVPGAAHLDPEFAISELPQDKSATLVFYCSNPLCRKAPNAARRAKKLGYEDVRVMSAGINGWLSAHLPTTSVAE